MARYFNTAGLCFPGKHYMVDPMPRLKEVKELIGKEFYFTLHAPRQTGKITYLHALSLEKAKKQLDRYLERLGMTEGYLVLFDPGSGDWESKLYRKEITYNRKTITIIGC